MNDDCKNCQHSKKDHQLALGRIGSGDFLPGTSMPSGKWNQKYYAQNVLAKTMFLKNLSHIISF